MPCNNIIHHYFARLKQERFNFVSRCPSSLVGFWWSPGRCPRRCGTRTWAPAARWRPSKAPWSTWWGSVDCECLFLWSHVKINYRAIIFFIIWLNCKLFYVLTLRHSMAVPASCWKARLGLLADIARRLAAFRRFFRLQQTYFYVWGNQWTGGNFLVALNSGASSASIHDSLWHSLPNTVVAFKRNLSARSLVHCVRTQERKQGIRKDGWKMDLLLWSSLNRKLLST